MQFFLEFTHIKLTKVNINSFLFLHCYQIHNFVDFIAFCIASGVTINPRFLLKDILKCTTFFYTYSIAIKKKGPQSQKTCLLCLRPGHAQNQPAQTDLILW